MEYPHERPGFPLRRQASCRISVVLLGIVIASCPVQQVAAHGDLHLQIARLNFRIRKAPTAELHVKRGELHQLHGDVPAALADFKRAEKLDPALEAIYVARGLTLFEAKSYETSLPDLDRVLASNPDRPDARLCRARTRAALGRHDLALNDYNHLVAVMPSPLPDCFLERAATLIVINRMPDALRGLEEGIARLGNLQVLEQTALDIELGLHRYDEALARVDRVMATLQRKEQWQALRGGILASTGRSAEARTAYAGALSSIAALPPHHRAAPSTRELETRLIHLLEKPSTPNEIPP